MSKYKYRLMGIPVLAALFALSYASGAYPIAWFVLGASIGHMIALAWMISRDFIQRHQ